MKVELLAPGGSYESVIAAYNAGADAVYTGGLMFGARAGADNLTTEQLIDAMNYAHINGKKLYLTVNTLLKDQEIENQLFDYIAPLYENGLDAVIVQDIGVIDFIRKHFKDLHIHASTQMTIFGSETVEVLKRLGVTRIVTPRELSISEIKDIHEHCDIEIESFVHGALCYCYSGQCFLSSYIGGRSGNRGRCAQPCRMEYDIITDEGVINQGNNKYVLSPKDICTLNILPQIIDSGVYSLKIEGRMKKTEYIAGVVSIYRKYIDMYLEHPDSYSVSALDVEKLSDLFNRNGFSESYYNQHNGKHMISLKKPEFRKENREFTEYLKSTYVGRLLKRQIDVEIVCKKNQPFEIGTSINNRKISVTGNVPGEALKKPIDEATIEKQIRKTGNTDFTIGKCDIQLDQDLFVPIGAINELRRQFLEKVSNHILSEFRRNITKSEQTYTMQEKIDDVWRSPFPNNKDNLMITADVWTKEQLSEVVKCDFISEIYLESSGFENGQMNQAIETVKQSGKSVYLALPYVFRKKDKNYFDKKLINYVQYVDGFLIRSPEQYYYLKNLGVAKKYIFDYNVYAGNRYAKAYYQKQGGKTTAPLELNYAELKERGCGGEDFIVYGYMPAMISAGCGLKTFDRCLRDGSSYKIKDRKNNIFYTKCVCEHCYNIMYNCKPLSLFKYKTEIERLNPDSVRLSFTVENQEETRNILKKARKTFVEGNIVTEDDKSTRGHFKRGVL